MELARANSAIDPAVFNFDESSGNLWVSTGNPSKANLYFLQIKATMGMYSA